MKSAVEKRPVPAFRRLAVHAWTGRKWPWVPLEQQESAIASRPGERVARADGDRRQDHEKITGFAKLRGIRSHDPDWAGRSGQEARTERAFLDSGGRIGRFSTSLNPPSPQGECGFKSRPGHRQCCTPRRRRINRRSVGIASASNDVCHVRSSDPAAPRPARSISPTGPAVGSRWMTTTSSKATLRNARRSACAPRRRGGIEDVRRGVAEAQDLIVRSEVVEAIRG